MQLDLDRTIVAVSSGPVAGRRAIIRLTGNDTARLLSELVSDSDFTQSAAGLSAANVGEACEAVDSLVSTKAAGSGPQTETIPLEEITFDRHCKYPSVTQAWIRTGWPDRNLPARIYFWPNSRSFTGEPCAEIHLLGSLPVVEAVLQELNRLGASPAERGEFTLRSFLAGKLDLPQAEAVLGVIEADDDQQLQWALAQLGGNLSTPIRELRDQLLELTAHLEAGLDFVEEDIEFISAEELAGSLRTIASSLQSIADRMEFRGGRHRIPHVLLVGLPNAGKSTLFNQLVGYDRAIVTDQAGTTRDLLSDRVASGDVEIQLFDTAGLEQLSSDSPRAMAQSMLRQRVEEADLVLFCLDLTAPVDPQWLSEQVDWLTGTGASTLIVGTKVDLLEGNSMSRIELITNSLTSSPSASVNTDPCRLASLDCSVNAFDPADLEELRQRIARCLADGSTASRGDWLQRTLVRCRHGIEAAIKDIERSIEGAEASVGEELVAAELRSAIDHLAAVIGEVHTEDILGEIFSRFCIGK